MSNFMDDPPVLAFSDWADSLDDLVDGTLEIFVRGSSTGRDSYYRGQISGLRISSTGQFIFELEMRRAFDSKTGRWSKTNEVERLLHPIGTRNLDFIMGPYLIHERVLFWTFGKRPYEPEQCVWVFPPEITAPAVPYSRDDVAFFVARFVEVITLEALRFD